MAKFTALTSQMVPLDVDNIDTDQIIPARYLKVTNKDGLADGAFADWRRDPDFILNNPAFAGRQILLAGDNFGCGSSREHAPWALYAFGFRAVISSSFADIFRSNALKNGLLPVAVSTAHLRDLFALVRQTPESLVTVDLPSESLEVSPGNRISFPIDAFAKSCLLQGIDQLEYLKSFDTQISAYEARPHKL